MAMFISETVTVVETFRPCSNASNRATAVASAVQWFLSTSPSPHTLTRETPGLTNFAYNHLTMSGTVSKIGAERNQKTLLGLAIKPGNGEYRLYPTILHGWFYSASFALTAPPQF